MVGRHGERQLRTRLTFEDKAADHDAPSIGFFWVLPTEMQEREFALASYIEPMADVPAVGGYRTTDCGHVDLWSAVCQVLPHLAGYEYEDFPRGRVNWRESDDRFLLLMDSRLFKPAVERSLLARYTLPADKTLIMPDSHYVSTAKVRGRFVGEFK